MQSAVDGSTWNDELVAVPFWANTQLLWYQKSVAEAAGLDMTQPVTWDQLIEAAEDQDNDPRRPGHPRRVADGVAQRPHRVRRRPHHRREPPTDPDEDRSSACDTEAGQRAAEVMHEVATSGVVGPAFSTAGEDASATAVRERRRRLHGQLAVRLAPGQRRRSRRARSSSRCPTTTAGRCTRGSTRTRPSRPPLRRDQPRRRRLQPAPGPRLRGRPSASPPRRTRPTTSSPTATRPSGAAVYDDPEVHRELPDGRRSSASRWSRPRPRPQTAYYSEVSGGLQRTYHPPTASTRTTAGRRPTT